MALRVDVEGEKDPVPVVDQVPVLTVPPMTPKRLMLVVDAQIVTS